jgi:hypothetical protein
VTDRQVGSVATSAALTEARLDLQVAVAVGDDEHRRTQYALAALDNAVTVLVARDATDTQLASAQQYLIDAQRLAKASGDEVGCTADT